jgi:hypothetical protein
MNRLITSAFLLVCLAPLVAAQNQIKVTPSNVNVYSQGATTVFVTYGSLGNYRPAETSWCGDVAPAAPDIGFRCVPGTIYGALPNRYDISRLSGRNAYTDIVSVPSSIARKAYQAAAAGEGSEFFYVRRFVSASGGPDQFVVVTMRLSGAGAGAPFSLTDVQLGFGASIGPTTGGSEPLVLFVEPNGKMPPIRAEIKYTGTGRLRGRWEVALPGDELPETRDLLTEASLPIEERGSQRRYTQVSRFNVFLAPGGRATLPGPDPARLPKKAAGQYLVLLRIEASDDRENNSNLADVGAGASVVQGGATAGFPMPVLRYIVGGGDNTSNVAKPGQFALVAPRDGATARANQPIDFVWEASPQAVFYRLEITADATGRPVLAAVLKAGVLAYRAPSWLKDKAGAQALRWRVVALDQQGNRIAETEQRIFRIAR